MVEREQLISMVRAVQQGEDGAATRLYNTFYYDIYCSIMDTVHDAELTADLTQNTFMEIFTTIGKLEEPAAFVTWSKQIAYHRCTAYFRKRSELLADEIGDHSLFDTIEETREEFIPGETLDKEDLKKAIHAMIDDLPPEQRSAIMMRYFEEIPIKEIAQRQGVTEGTVKSRLNYGRQAIKRSVEKYEKKHGIKLYCNGVIPLLLWLFREYRVVNSISLTANVTSAAITTGAVTTAAASSAALTTTASAGTGVALTTKVVAGIVTVAVAVGGVTAAVVTTANDAGRYTLRPTVSSQASELSLVLSTDGTHYEVRGVGVITGSEIVIPAEYNGLPVTTISPYAFMDCSSIVSITIPDSISTIGEQAFSGCAGLTSLTIPNGVTEIQSGTFLGCSGLSSVFLPEGVAAIGNAAFWGCGSLAKLTIPNSVTSIGAGAFCDCGSLTGLSLSANVSDIGDHAFAGCTGLEYITVAQDNAVYHSAGNCLIETEGKTLTIGCKNSLIPTDGSVTSIGPSAFDERTDLTRISIPASVTVIQSTAFYGCENLTDLYYSGTMSQWDAVAHGLDTDGIGDYSVHCTDGIVYQGIHQAVVPESHRGIAFHLSSDGTFYLAKPSTYAVKEAVIPSAYNGLPVRQVMFFSCEELVSVSIPDSVTAIEAEAFAFCSALTRISLPHSITTIGDHAFSGCSSLTEITIPAGVEYFGKKAFASCTALTDIHYSGTMKQWNSIQKESHWDDLTGMYTIHCADGDISKEVPPSAPMEGSEGLSYTLNNDGISYTVSGIGSCTDTNIRIPAKYNGLHVTAVEEEAFYGSAQITGIRIPATVTSISPHMIGETPNLETLVVEEGNPVYHSEGNCIIETETKTLIIGCKNSVIPADGSVNHIGDYAFFSSGLTVVSIPDTVTTIGHAGFSHNFDLTKITLPVTITEIGSNSFNLCSSLTDIHYSGTMAQWNELYKGTNWNYETGAYTIHCADGDIPRAV